MKSNRKTITIFLSLFFLVACLVYAGDVQIDIAVLPYTISQSGSYVVTCNISLSTTNTNGITISANDVSLDLNGHTLKGPGKAAGTSGSGISVSSARYNIVIRNGIIRDWRLIGVSASNARNSQFESLQCYYNGTHGLTAGRGCIVKENTCSFNDFEGISAEGSTIIQNVCYSNGRNGISATSGCLIESNNCRYNGAAGISGGVSAIVSKNNCYSNTGDGITVYSNCYVFENNCNGNGSGTGDGAGINITGSDNSIERNLVTDNDRGIDCNPAIGNIIFSTRASGNTTNYDIADSNLFGEILTLLVTIPNPGLSLSNSYANFNF